MDEHESDRDTVAADEPTAMWDGDVLREAGLDEVAERHEAPKPEGPKVPPVRPSRAMASTRPIPRPPQKRSAGLSWGATVALAVGLGALAFAIVRFLR